jgi:hypothetical protein
MTDGRWPNSKVEISIQNIILLKFEKVLSHSLLILEVSANGHRSSAIESALEMTENKKGEDSYCTSPFYDGKYHPPKYKQLGCFVNVILR